MEINHCKSCWKNCLLLVKATVFSACIHSVTSFNTNSTAFKGILETRVLADVEYKSRKISFPLLIPGRIYLFILLIPCSYLIKIFELEACIVKECNEDI